MDRSRKLVLAVLLGALWAALAVWQWGAWQEPMRVPLAHVSGPPASASQRGTTPVGLRVRLELLDTAKSQRETAFSAPRNIFAVLRPEGAGAAAREILDPTSDQALLQQAAAAELSQYRYLGFLRMADQKQRQADMAVLSKNEEVVVVKVGDRFDHRLVLKAMTREEVTIRDIGARIEQTVPLSNEVQPQP